MKTVLLYLHVASHPGEFMDYSRRFMDTYRRFPGGADHELHIGNCNGPLTPEAVSIFSPEARSFHHYRGGGFDIGAELSIAQIIHCDFLVCACATTYFKRAGWMARMCDARKEIGDGMFGALSSYQVCPHLRTNFYGINPERLRQYPYAINSKEDSYRFEHREWNIVSWMASIGFGSWLVTWDGIWEMARWRTPPNLFRKGDQSNCLAYDRHTDIYDNSPPAARAALAAATG